MTAGDTFASQLDSFLNHTRADLLNNIPNVQTNFDFLFTHKWYGAHSRGGEKKVIYQGAYSGKNIPLDYLKGVLSETCGGDYNASLSDDGKLSAEFMMTSSHATYELNAFETLFRANL
jgi:hypothetical protein